ncbi:MAG: efflux RND transporter periplasmic adaptor subunit [Vicinamibacterales bacterium]
MKRVLWLSAAALVAAGIFYTFSADAGASAPDLSYAEVERGTVVQTVDATGTLEPLDTVDVGTQVGGTVADLGADFNDTVHKGQVIATLDQAAIRSQIEQAEASVIRLRAEQERAEVQLADAEQKLKRARQLGDAGLLAAADVETAATTAEVARAGVRSAHAQLAQAEAQLAQAKVNLSYTVISAPVDGIILSRNVERGQTVSTGLQTPTLFVIARGLDSLRLAASIAESDVGLVQAGQPVSFTVDAYPQATFHGTLRQVRLQPTVVQNVVSYTAMIDVPNPDGRLKPGMTATVSVEVARADDVLTVPAAALRFQPSADVLAAFGGAAEATSPGGAGRRGHVTELWQLVAGRLTATPVRTGLSDGVRVALTGDPLPEGAQVITGASAATASTAPASSGSPLVPTPPRRGGR